TSVHDRRGLARDRVRAARLARLPGDGGRGVGPEDDALLDSVADRAPRRAGRRLALTAPILRGMRRTLVEAIAERHVVDGAPRRRPPRARDLVTLAPARTMSHDNTSAIMKRFRDLGGTRLAHPSRVSVVLDHDIQNRSAANLSKYAAIEAFAREQGASFHPA